MKIIGLNTKTMEEVEFESVQQAQKEVGNKGTVIRCLNGELKSSKGWLFRYEGEDFSDKAKTITDKRIKVYELTKDDEVIRLPLEMLQNKVGISKSSIIEASRGYKKNPNGARIKTKFAKGYTVKELTKEEASEVLESISYIDYLKSKQEAKPLERKQSMGEHIVDTMLKENDINFQTEVPIPNTRLLMDFYVEEYNTCIEYQGVHHDRNRYKGASVDVEQKERYDTKKREYCEEKGINLVYINHDDTFNNIYNKIKEFIPLQSMPKVYTLYREKEINIEEFLKYYLTTNRERTANKYDLKQTDVKNILDKLEYSSKRVPTETIKVYDAKTNEYLGEGDYYSVQKDFGIHKSAVSAMKSGRAKSSKGFRLEFLK